MPFYPNFDYLFNLTSIKFKMWKKVSKNKIKKEIDQGIYFLSDEKITYDFIDKIKVLLEESDEEVFG